MEKSIPICILTCSHGGGKECQVYVQRGLTNDEMLTAAKTEVQKCHPDLPFEEWVIEASEGLMVDLPDVQEAQPSTSGPGHLHDIKCSPFRKKRDSKDLSFLGHSSTGGTSPVAKKLATSPANLLQGLTSSMNTLSPFKDSSVRSARKELFLKETEDLDCDWEASDVSSIVRVSNVCAPFFKDAFHAVITHTLLEQGIEANGWVKDIRDYSEANRTVLIEFSNSTQALQVSAMSMKWMLEPLVFETLEKETEDYRHILIDNIPQPYSEELLRSYLARVMVQEGIIDNQGQEIISSVSSYDETKKSVVVEFVSHEVCAPLVKRKELDFLWGGKVSFSPFIDSSILVPIDDEDQVNELTTAAVPTDTSKLSTCWFGYETCQLLVACIQNRILLRSRSTKMIGEGWRNVEAAMLAKGLNFGMKALKSRLRSIRSYAATAGPQYEYASLVQEFEGVSAPGSGKVPEKFLSPAVAAKSNGNGQEVKGKPKKTAKKMYGVTVIDGTVVVDAHQTAFSTDQDFCLIDEYKLRKKRFDDDKTHATVLWNEISTAFNLKFPSAHYSADKLCNRMAYLAMQFKVRYDNLMNCTGSSADALNWTCYDKMSMLFEGSHALQPTKLVAFGAECSSSERSRSSSGECDGQKPKLKRAERQTPPTMKERKVLACEAMLEEIRRANNLYLAAKKED